MVWLKCSDDYSDGCISLTDAEYRTLHEALLWVMRREVGPRFPKRELRRFADLWSGSLGRVWQAGNDPGPLARLVDTAIRTPASRPYPFQASWS